MAETPTIEEQVACCPELAWWTEIAAWVLACVAVAGSLYLTLGMKLVACPLCLYQRLLAMGVVAVILSGWLFVQGPGRGLAVLALPLSVGGLTVALFHVSKEWQQAMVCPLGLFGWGTAPQQSATLFTLITMLLVVSILSGAGRQVWLPRGVPAVVILAVLGLAIAFGMIRTGPPPQGGDSLEKLLEKRAAHQLAICTPVKYAKSEATTSAENTPASTNQD
ncbi:MAG: disulfide bond formation protein B [Gemmatales bacterium]|nr:disulfide bond formation protein B [Gemmatales bacterium]